MCLPRSPYKKTLIQDDVRDLHPIDRGAGGQDQAMEPQHRCDHLPEDKGQIQPLDQEPHVRLRPRSWPKIPSKYSGIMWVTGKWVHFHQDKRREYYLITLMGLKEAGEKHFDLRWRLILDWFLKSSSIRLYFPSFPGKLSRNQHKIPVSIDCLWFFPNFPSYKYIVWRLLVIMWWGNDPMTRPPPAFFLPALLSFE